MGTQGCVSFMFTKKGVLVIEREDLDKDEDTVMSDALEYGASDFEADEDVFTIYTEPEDFSAVRDDLEKQVIHSFLPNSKWYRAHTQRLMTRMLKQRCRKCLICLRTTMTFRMFGTTGKWKTDLSSLCYQN